MERKSGVLMPIASLPGEYAIGDFGWNARNFIDEIAEMGFRVWQILPITTIGLGNSPYSGTSAFAGNGLLIDPEKIPHLSNDEKNAAKRPDTKYAVDYDAARETKGWLIRLSYSRLSEDEKKVVKAFAEKTPWLKDYCEYRVLKDNFEQVSWAEFPEEFRKRKPSAMKKLREEYAEDLGYYEYEQYLFSQQWEALHDYAKERGMEIFGDMPIYVSYDSADVWANPEQFLLDEELKPTKVAGVPPDYFSATGQLWGNPLFNYRKIGKDFAYPVARLQHHLKLYDILRIDHFRGLHRYWAVPAGETTAINGSWEKGPGMGIWEALKKKVPNPKIVAEDLGMIDEEAHKYREQTGFPGMRVFHFAFDGDKKNLHLPYNYDRNTVAYTATHDNNTTLGWLYSLDDRTRGEVLDYLGVSQNGWGQGGGHCPSARAAVTEILKSTADLAIVPLQDLAGYGADTRFNTPGVAEGNWGFRLTHSCMDEVDNRYWREINARYGR